MLSKFLIKRTGEIFYYDNQSNVLLDGNRRPLFQSLTENELIELKKYQQIFSSTTKTSNPSAIKIVLGHGCNYNCSYCLQQDIGNPNERKRNDKTQTLIQSINKHLNIQDVSRIELWGGETLLYWNDIVDIITEFDREGITWYIPTNGTLLKYKHVEFFASLKGDVAIGISHDGPGHQRLRGPDFLDRKAEILREIQRHREKIQFSFNPVISSTNYDLFEIDQYFSNFLRNHQLDPVHLNYELGRIYDENTIGTPADHVISGETINQYRKILKEYLNAHLAIFAQRGMVKTREDFLRYGHVKNSSLLTTNLFHTGLGVIPYAKTLKYQGFPIVKTNCGADDATLLTINLDGNVLSCQNVDRRFADGNIANVQSVNLSNYLEFDRDQCKQCHVYRLCKGSCPLTLGDKVFEKNHAIELAHYSEIQLAAFRLLFQSEISYLGSSDTAA